MITHQRAITRIASETFSSRKVLIARTAMSYIRALAIDRVGEKFYRSHVITSEKHTTRLLDAILDESQWNQSAALLTQSASWLLFSVIWVEIDVPTSLRHSITGDFKKEETSRIGVNDVDELQEREELELSNLGFWSFLD